MGLYLIIIVIIVIIINAVLVINTDFIMVTNLSFEELIIVFLSSDIYIKTISSKMNVIKYT